MLQRKKIKSLFSLLLICLMVGTAIPSADAGLWDWLTKRKKKDNNTVNNNLSQEEDLYNLDQVESMTTYVENGITITTYTYKTTDPGVGNADGTKTSKGYQYVDVTGEKSIPCEDSTPEVYLGVNDAEDFRECDVNGPILASEDIVYGVSRTTVELHVQDDSGLKFSKYSWTSAAACLSSGTNFVDSEDIDLPGWGKYTLNLCAEDKAGNPATFTRDYIADNIDPLLNASNLIKVDEGFEVELYVSDAQSGIKTAKYSWVSFADCANGTNFVNEQKIDAKWGENTLYLCAEDNTGLTSEFSKSYIADDTPPTLTISGPTYAEVTNSFAENVPTITIKASDIPLQSGLKIAKYSWSSAANCVTSGTDFAFEADVTVTKPSPWEDGTLYLCAEDNAGLTSALTLNYLLENNDPILDKPQAVGADVTGGGQYSTSTTVIFEAAPTDAESGIESCEAQIKEDEAIPTSLAVTIDNNKIQSTYIGDNGKTYIYQYKCTDFVGNESNWSNWSDGIMVDTEAPVLQSQTTFDTDWYNSNQPSYFNYVDAESGIASGNPQNCIIADEGGNSTCTKTGVNVCDNAGNCNTTNQTSNSIKLDKTRPTCGFSGTGWVTLPAEVSPLCTDAVSGCKDPVVYEIENIDNMPEMRTFDEAEWSQDCDESDLMIHYIEIRGLQGNPADQSVKQELTNLIRQNVADLIRNQNPNENESIPTYAINNGTVAYYEGDVTLNTFNVIGKKTIIVKDGNLTLNGNINYTNGNSILGIIVLGSGNVIVGKDVGVVNAILFAEGSLLSQDQESLVQLYWKGSVITDNTVGGVDQEKDLNFFRMYHPNQAGAVNNDTRTPKSNAPSIIEYDSSVQQNVPYGFEQSSDFNFQGIVN